MSVYEINKPVITPNGVGYFAGRLRQAGRPDRVLVSHARPGHGATPPVLFAYPAQVVIPWPKFTHRQAPPAPALFTEI